MCKLCSLEFGSCELFKEYEISVTQLKETSLRSSDNADLPSESSSVANHLILSGSVCSIRPA